MRYKFQSYHPFLSYTGDIKGFMRPNGLPSFSDLESVSDSSQISDDLEDLWRLGRTAFAEFPKFENIEKFEEYHKLHLDGVQGLKEIIQDASKAKGFVFSDYDGVTFAPDWESLSTDNVLNIYWQLALTGTKPSDLDFLAHHFLFVCLENIDNAIIGIFLGQGAISSAIAAVNAYANFEAIDSGNAQLQQARSDLAMRGAIERHRRDPKQAAKQFVEACWHQWQASPSRYGSQTAFANDVLDKVQTNGLGIPIISFDTIVKKWIPDWTRKKRSNSAGTVGTMPAQTFS